MPKLPYKVIAFDADDTLWDCQSHFEEVEEHLYSLIAPYCENPKRELFETESGNMADLGYGCKAFTISILETAMRVAGNDLSTSTLAELLRHCKQLLHLPATPLPGVETTLAALKLKMDDGRWKMEDVRCKMVVFTKGELQDQENKLKRSGLLQYFDDVEITSDKSEKEFLALCEHQQIAPSELLMIGNSLKSDITPALAIGASAIYIPFHVTWQLEHVEEFEHERMVRIEKFSEILKFI